MEKGLIEAIRLSQNAQAIEPSITPCGKPCPDLDTVKHRLNRGDQILSLIPILIDRIDSLDSKLGTMEGKIDQTKEIVSAWGNIKGFGKTMSMVSNILKVSTPIVLFVGFVYLLFLDPQAAFTKARIWLTSK